MSTVAFQKLALTTAIAGLFLAGCGGGGGGGGSLPPLTSTTLSGTVAGGAAVIGTVLITDSKGATKTANIEANGHYSFDVSTMTGPFVLKAAGTVGDSSVTYYSAATAADIGGTVNVTPFTNLMVSNIAAQLAETYFSNPANIATLGTLITSDKLIAAETALQAKLQPVLSALGISDSIDLLRSAFAADHSGIDAVLDLVKVEADTTTNIFTIKNALSQATIATDNATVGGDDATAVDSTKITDFTPEKVTDLQAVITKLNSFAALFANSLPSTTTMANAGVFDTSSNFLMGGKGFDQFATEMSTQQSAIGMKFSSVAIALDESGTSGTLNAVVTSNTPSFSETIQLKMVKLNGVWMVQGDGRIADVSLYAQASRNEWMMLPTSNVPNGMQGAFIQSGINIWIDPFAYNSTSGHIPVASALITGPGLSSGITMVQDPQNRELRLSNATYTETVVVECGSNDGNNIPITTQCVNIAQALDNSEYTVILKDSNGNALNGAGYKLILPKQPYVTNTLTSAMFPNITSIMIDGAPLTPSTVVANKSVAVSWTMPSGLQAKDMNIWANTTVGETYFRVEKDLLPTDTTALIGLGSPMATGTVSNAGVWLQSADAYGRRFGLSKSVQSQ